MEDYFKNLSEKLNLTPPKFKQLELFNMTLVNNNVPLLWDFVFEKIIFNETEIKESLTTLGDNYFTTTEIEMKGRTVHDGFFQELGRFKKLKNVLIEGPKYDAKSKVGNSLEMKNGTFYPYNGFEVN